MYTELKKWEAVVWDEVCRVIQWMVTWYKKMAVKVLEHMIIDLPSVMSQKHCNFIFLQRTENLNTWQRSIGCRLKLNRLDYRYGVQYRTSFSITHCACKRLLTITRMIAHRHCLSYTTDMTHMHTLNCPF